MFLKFEMLSIDKTIINKCWLKYLIRRSVAYDITLTKTLLYICIHRYLKKKINLWHIGLISKRNAYERLILWGFKCWKTKMCDPTPTGRNKGCMQTVTKASIPMRAGQMWPGSRQLYWTGPKKNTKQERWQVQYFTHSLWRLRKRPRLSDDRQDKAIFPPLITLGTPLVEYPSFPGSLFRPGCLTSRSEVEAPDTPLWR